MPSVEISWKQQARQLTFLKACGLSHPFDGGKPSAAKAKVIGYGGAAGGGKSDALLMMAIIGCLSFAKIQVGYFRRKFTQLEGPGGAIMRSHQLIAGIAKYNQQKRRWTFPNGSIIQFCYLEHESDVHNYQSQQFDILCFDEATQFTRSQVRYMMTRNRSTTSNMPRPFAAMATNPGNVGHLWFKEEFVQAGVPEQVHNVEVEPGKYEEHMFIPAKLSDNQALEERDPEYRKNLENQPELIRRQLLEGDWDAAEGVAFPEWRDTIHVCDPFKIPDEWIRFTACDWGYAKPYSVGWYAVDYDGRLWKYRELYGCEVGKQNEGVREDPEEVANKMKEMETYTTHDGKVMKESIRYRVIDDACFGGKQDNHKTIAEQFADAGIYWQPVGKGPGSRIAGKLEVHHRLKWEKDNEGKWDGEHPMLVVFNTCRATIRTIPVLIQDDNRPEDVDTEMEDHAYDETRYACQSRPLVPKQKKSKETVIEKRKKAAIRAANENRRRIL